MLSKSPAVIAFGWLGCKDYNLRKVGRIYAPENIEFKFMIQSPLSILNIKSDQKKFDEIYNYAKNKDVICHIFSLNGASSFIESLMRPDLTDFKPNLNIKGLIWDSAPGFAAEDTYHEAFAKSMFPKSPRKEKVTSALLNPFFKAFLHFSKKHNEESKEKYRLVYKNPFKLPQLVMGSKNDSILNWKDMKAYAEKACEAGSDVQTRFWNDSGHVSLYKDHFDEYQQLVLNFARKNLYER